MRALKQTGARVAIALAMLAAALGAGAGCSDDFEPYSRLSSLRVADLEALLAYEDATKSRPPFQTLLANRITRATAK